jgi:predicted signal transduction protein with EAL and GGDEF domain
MLDWHPITLDDCDYFLTASFGYAAYPTDAMPTGSLISYADTAMHEIKRQNKNERILRFTHDLSKAEPSAGAHDRPTGTRT